MIFLVCLRPGGTAEPGVGVGWGLEEKKKDWGRAQCQRTWETRSRVLAWPPAHRA